MINPISKTMPQQATFLTRQQAVKVVAVAVAALVCFGASYALMCASMTFFAEAELRNGSQHDWFDTRTFSVKRLFLEMNKSFAIKLLITATLSALTALGIIPAIVVSAQIKLVEMCAKAPLKFAFRTIVIAPICEEILFRGFLYERAEDAARLFNRHIHPITERAQKRIANVVQASLFGFAHITNNQVEASAKWSVALATGWFGFVFGQRREKTDSLLYSTSEHAMNNAVTFPLFIR